MANPTGGFRARNKGKTFEDVTSELEERIVCLEEYVTWDKELRAKHPALQDLYEKFQTARALLK